MHRFRCDALDSPVASRLKLDGAESSHLFKTLRAQPGEEVELLDGKGSIGKAKVMPGRELELLSVRKEPPPERRLHLYLAPPRRQKTDQILRQSVELGIWRIVPITCLRSVSLPDADSVEGRWTDLLFDACKQSGNPFLPELSAPIAFEASLPDASRRCGAALYGAPGAETRNPLDCTKGAKDVAWFVGPEGGFAPEELAMLQAANFIPLRIGRWTLRVETAALCGAALLVDA